jgi:hypothetical protein
MSWEQEISKELQEVSDMAVRFDIDQELSVTEKTRARDNIGYGASVASISGDDYKIIFS